MSVARTILLQGEEARYHEERNAAAAITPGDLLKLNADNTVQDHDTAGAATMIWVAKEDYLQGKTIDQAYAVDDVVAIHNAQKGHKLNLRLAASQTIAIGDGLTSNGDGKIKKANGTTDAVLFNAAEAVTTGAGETKRCAAYVR